MTTIVLTPEQAGILQSAQGQVAICLPDGSIAGFVATSLPDLTPKEPLFTEAEIAEAEKALKSDGPWFTTSEVLDHLRSMDAS